MLSKSLSVTTEPKVLVWARETMGFTVQEVARRLKVNNTTAIDQWERGERHPTLRQAEGLAKIYKRPLAVFFLPTPPKEPPFPPDFRTLPSDKRRSFSPKTRLAIRRARRLQSLIVELTKDFKQEAIPSILRKVSPLDDPEVVATTVREQLGVITQAQLNWKNEDAALEEWKKAVERLGVFVFQLSVPLEEIRGFSLTEQNVPVIVLNRSDSTNARIFTLFHEYAHLLLFGGGICDMTDNEEVSSEVKQIEKFCNHFSGALLVPKNILMEHVQAQRLSSGWSEETLKQLSEVFKISVEAILRRLAILGLVTTDFYQRKREEWRTKIEEWAQQKKSVYKINLPRRCIRENGIPFVSLVLERHRQEKITYSDVADYLGIRLKHLSQVERLITTKG